MTDLRAEAEKVAAQAVTTEMLMRMGKAAYKGGYNFDMQRELQSGVADAIIAFATRYGEMERLRGRIEVMEGAVAFLQDYPNLAGPYAIGEQKARAKLEALEKGAAAGG